MKRVADSQLTKDAMSDEDKSVGGGGPQRATAAQMAARKIKTLRSAAPRSSRTPTNARPQGTLPPSIHQQALPSFSGWAGGQQHGGGGVSNQTSASFPPDSSANNNINNPAPGNSFNAPTTSFSFNTPPTTTDFHNPFTALDTGNSAPLPPTTFQGSIFKVDTPDTDFQRFRNSQNTPKYAPGGRPLGISQDNWKHSHESQKEPTWDPRAHSQDLNGQTNGMTQDQLQNQANPFGSATSQQQQNPNSNNLFLQPSNVQQQETNMFGQGTVGQSTGLKRKERDSDDTPLNPHIFNNPFGQSQQTQQNQQPQQPPSTPNMFGVINTQPSQASNNFAQAPSNSPQQQFQYPAPPAWGLSQPPHEDTMMQTTPDNSPFGGQQQQTQQQQSQPTPAPFSFLNQPQPSPTKNAGNSSAGSSLFDRISRPSPEPSFQSISGPTNANSSQATGGSFFDGVSQPTPEKNSQPTSESTDAISTRSSGRASLFTGVSKPPVDFTAVSTFTNDQNLSAQSNPFGNFTAPSATQATTSSSPFSFGSTVAPNTQSTTSSSPFKLGPPTPATTELTTSTSPFKLGPQPSAATESSTTTSPFKLGPPTSAATESSASTSLFKPGPTGFPKSFESINEGANTDHGMNNIFSTPSASNALSTNQNGCSTSDSTSKNLFNPPNANQSRTETQTASNQDSEGGSVCGSPPTAPADFTEEEKRQLITGYRLKQLDVGMQKHLRHNPMAKDQAVVREFYAAKKQAILDANGGHLPSFKRKTNDEVPEGPSPAKQTKNTSSGPINFSSSTANKATQPLQPPTNTYGKRKADDSLAREDFQTSSDSSKRARGPASTSPNSQTSSLFMNILGTEDPATVNGAQVNESGTGSSSSIYEYPAASSSSSLTTGGSSTQSLFQTKPPERPTSKLSASTAPQQTFFRNPPAAKPSAGVQVQTTRNTNAPKAPAFKLPTFGTGASGNFMSQFGQAAKKTEEEEKKKRKAEEFDSEEEDEAEWERKDAEEQRKKKLKIMEAAEAAKASHSFVLNATDKQNDNASNKTARSHADSGLFVPQAPQAKPTGSSLSVLDKAHPSFNAPNGHTNIFGHVSDVESGAEGSKTGDADDEHDESEEDEPLAQKTPFGTFSSPFSTKPIQSDAGAPNTGPPPGRSLFDRVSKPASAPAPAHVSNIFGQSGSINLGNSPFAGFTGFKTSNNKSEASSATPQGDHTWRPDSPIKFSPEGPAVNVTSPSPSKAPLSGLFGASKTNAPPETPTKPAATSMFSTTPTTTPSANFGFGFSPAKPATGLAPPSNGASNVTSRATSPGATTGESANESNAEGAEDDAGKDEQLDLAAGGPGEENETVLFEVTAKALHYDTTTKQWIQKGLGQLRVLQDPGTKKTRMLLRQRPSGRVAVNTSLVKDGTYGDAGSKSVRMPIVNEAGKLQTWTMKVGRDEDAKRLLQVLQDNKNH